MECEAIERQERRRAAIPPVSPKESVRQDIVRHLVEDLWLELVPTIRPLVDALPPTETLASNAAYQESRLHELRFGSESDGDSDDDLLSAMTIKPVYLQKRDSSARHRSSHDLMALAAANLVPEFYAFSRPASSRPTSARVPALRAASGRPTSGRNPEVSGYAGYHTNTSRMQGSTVSKSGPAWKRYVVCKLCVVQHVP
ncbi:hypothetical protein BC832DRAFT_231125 [Gaertneriomyces semiglobifer]|nr:hypothetical protein BC832DRAFT_231125 [Gaertneriomyces semiglobifer]